jgi:hypothetical protein
MSAQQQNLIQIIERVHRRTHAPVLPVSAAMEAYISDRHARRLLADLARAGYVKRVGIRKGYLPLSA